MHCLLLRSERPLEGKDSWEARESGKRGDLLEKETIDASENSRRGDFGRAEVVVPCVREVPRADDLFLIPRQGKGGGRRVLSRNSARDASEELRCSFSFL